METDSEEVELLNKLLQKIIGKGKVDYPMPQLYLPKIYPCIRCNRTPKINGRLDDTAWDGAPWTDDFCDIQGDKQPSPRFRTRAKMLWDNSFLYVGAELEEPHVNASLSEKNSIIFNDNDFEVFIDPDGDNYNYYEFEINALNTVWELTLPRPYRAGGEPELGTNLEGLQSAVHINGTLNVPTDTDVGWGVTIAFPWSGLEKYCGIMPCPPRPGNQWRINFSRVEWLFDIINGTYRKIPKSMRPEDNWVWSPQGVIDMHRPWTWGVVEFCESVPEKLSVSPMIEAQQKMGLLYESQRSRHDIGLSPTDNLEDLALPFASESISIAISGEGWVAEMPWTDSDGSRKICRVDHMQHFTWR